MRLLGSTAGSVGIATAAVLAGFAALWLALDLRTGTDSEPAVATPVSVTVAGETMTLPGGYFRFVDQRRAAKLDRVDLLLRWPDLGEAIPTRRAAPSEIGSEPDLIFVSIARRDVALDSTARLATVYQRFFQGPAFDGPAGLVGQRMADGSGYEDELVFFEPGSVRPFATRCFAGEEAGRATICLREVMIGRDLIMTYRFAASLLPAWQALDRDLRDRVDGFLGG